MSDISVKFGIGEVFYTFDSDLGAISRHVVSAIRIESPTSSSGISVLYITAAASRLQFYEYEVYNSTEVTELANNWLLEKSVTIFSSVGL